ncbi:malonyl-CoA synthase [Steroidobacter agaridevorans]|uniref:Malonyl-CoA synthase n=1 Tax=Steroidobacter agaridevorans TaxID=2695856 RepID=A0A829YEG6_9GAMM|nr:malonyl-CoA synthase [Steroidobacter agaridevorans]GFE81620.1 malonyl-CoA synthase [Steroidobacter agaridevorans]
MSNAAATDAPSRWLETVAASDPERLLLETGEGRRLNYGQMAALTRRLAGSLTALEVKPGDRVVAQIEKSPEAIALYLACLHLGATFVPLNTAYTFAELEYFLGDAAPTVAVVRPADRQPVQAMAATCGVKHVETLDDRGGGSLLDIAGTAPESSAHAPATLAALLYTSGTTGRSKGAMLTRANLSSNALTLAHAWRFSSSDVLLHALPIFHVHGLFVAINTVLASGSSMLFLSKFDADQVVRLLPRATVMMGVPTFYTRLLQHPGLHRDAVGNVRLFVSGSAPLLAETHREFQARTGHAILERYGMSETLMNTSNPYQGRRIPGSVGPALPGVEVRITDPDSGAPLAAADAIGMIEVRGPNVFSGYWRMPEKTAAEFRKDGFFITGDLGKRDAQGYVYIVGRGKDLIITGGYNVYPIEVELEIDALPGVNESAVIGVPHPDFGEGVTAVVVPNKNQTLQETEIRNALEQRLAKFKLPKRIVFVDELPRNTMGKVQKSALRERYRDLYN